MKHLLLFVISLSFVGCATSGKSIDQDKISQIKEGETTKNEVIALLGKPEVTTLTSDAKEIMMYHHFNYKTRPSTFMPVVGLFTGGGVTHQQVLQILVDKDGKVEKFIFTDSESPINTGILNTSK